MVLQLTPPSPGYCQAGEAGCESDLGTFSIGPSDQIHR